VLGLVKFIFAVVAGAVLAIIIGAIFAVVSVDYTLVGLVSIGVFIITIVIIMNIDFSGMRKVPMVSEARQRYLLFGGLLMSVNNESNKAFKIVRSSPKEARVTLAGWWGIESHAEAIYVAMHLSLGNIHTDFADDIYNNLIKKGISDPTPEDLAKLKLEHAQQVGRIKLGLLTYDTAKKQLIRIGYTEAELAQITTLAAWDYGRTAFVSRFSAHSKFITEDEAWTFIKAAAENAASTYDNWKQYLAAYVLGRCIAYGEFLNIGAGLFGENSVYSKTSFKAEDDGVI